MVKDVRYDTFVIWTRRYIIISAGTQVSLYIVIVTSEIISIYITYIIGIVKCIVYCINFWGKKNFQIIKEKICKSS